MAIALMIVVHAFAVASEVRITPAVLVVLAAEVETIRDARMIIGVARTSAVMMRIADLGMDNVLDWSMAADSALLPEAMAFVIVVHAFAVAAKVRIALAVLVVLAAEVEAIRDARMIGDEARTSTVTMRIADLGMDNVLDWSMAADSAFLPEAIALVIVMHAFAVAAHVRIAPAVLVVLAAEVETIRDARTIGDGARTAAVVIRIARVVADAEWRRSIDHSRMCADGETGDRTIHKR